MPSHQDRILDQFTRQAVPFSDAPSIRDQAALSLLVESSKVTKDDRVLDVACGPGLVVRAFAEVARHVTGIDVTPAMIARAREVVAGIDNVSLDQGDVTSLPYASGAFDVVVSRFAFHHFPDPSAVLGEMKRVCTPGGQVVVCDLIASDDPRKAAGFHEIEMIRDPSHYRAWRRRELEGFFEAHGLEPQLAGAYLLNIELENYLSRSFPIDGDRDALRERYVASMADDDFGLKLRRVGDEVHGAYDVVILRAGVS